MRLPKLAVVGVPSDMLEDEIISDICEKNEQLNQLVESGKTLEVVKCRDMKNTEGDIQHKKFAIKSSPEIRSYIMNMNVCYIFIGLCRCKVHDIFFDPQCFRCNEFIHFANICPNKSNP